MGANTYGRQVVLSLTNKSGGGVIAGDVVVVDTTNDAAFTTSTAGALTGGVGIAQETIASNATGRVLVSGYAALVNVNASVTRGNFGKTYTVAKQGTDAGSSRLAGTFCQFLTGGATPTARVYPPDLGMAGLGAWTTYTPTLTNVTVGDGTLEGRYKALDASTYLWHMSFVLGSTSSVTGAITVALPATARTGSIQTCSGYVLDSGTAYFVISGKIASAGTAVSVIVVADAAGTRIAQNGTPITWATGDELALWGTLEV